MVNCKYAEFSDSSPPPDTLAGRESIDFKKLLEVTVEWPTEIERDDSPTTKLMNYLVWLKTELGEEYVELFVNGYLATFAYLVGADLISKLCLKTNVVHRTLVRRRDRPLHCRQNQSSSDSQRNRGERAI